MSPVAPELEREESHPEKIRKDCEITGWRIRLYYWSRNPHILGWAAVAIVSIGILCGYLSQPADAKGNLAKAIEHLRTKFIANMDGTTGRTELAAELLAPSPGIGRTLASLRFCNSTDEKTVTTVTQALQASRLQPEEKNLALAYWTSLCSHLGEPGADLLYFAHQPQPQPYANELVGDFYSSHPKKFERTLAHFERELKVRPDAREVRRKIVGLHWEKQDFATLATLRREPAYAALFDARMSFEISRHQHDWPGVWSSVLALEKDSFSDRIPLILTAVAGAVWLVLAWQMGQPRGFFSFRIWAPLIAIPLGAASTLPVLFLDVYESEMWGLKHTGLFFEDCLFFLAGVGVREELCKLLFFVPFLPVLLRRKCRLEMLLVAGAVGLGFAIEENINYFRVAAPSQAFARFLTANFFHFAATGIIGLSLCDAIREFRTKWWHFPAAFVSVAAAHGFYDAFGSVPAYLFTALALSCFILLSLVFFRQVARERGPATDQMFPAATLVLGLAVLVATILTCASSEFGLSFALDAVWEGGLSLGVFVYMFFVLFRDGLHEDEPLPPVNFEPL